MRGSVGKVEGSSARGSGGGGGYGVAVGGETGISSEVVCVGGFYLQVVCPTDRVMAYWDISYPVATSYFIGCYLMLCRARLVV